jgi:tartrate-resistant acid phosphatase type 5
MMTGSTAHEAARKALAFIPLLALTLGSCATTPMEPAQSYEPVSLLVFGDHGYNLDYLEPEDRIPRTRAELIALEREEWAEDKLLPERFTPSAMVQLPETGGYVAASGMMPVAHAMTAYCRTAPCDAAVMLGDNIYPNGPIGQNDAQRFADILYAPFHDFGSFAPDFRIYATLGNHDWNTSRAAAMGEVRYMETTPPFYMDGTVYRVTPPAGHGEVELFVLDTEVLLAGTTVYEDALADDGSEIATHEIDEPDPWVKPETEIERNMVAWLERSLKESTARWKIVMGHHPLWSSSGSKFTEARALRRLILPTLCKYADMYLAGHEHTLELHTDSCAKAVPGAELPPLPEIVSGAASKQRPVNIRFMAHQAEENPELATQFAKGMVWGYTHLTLEGDRAVVRVMTTPLDGSGANVVEATETYARRSGELTAERGS